MKNLFLLGLALLLSLNSLAQNFIGDKKDIAIILANVKKFSAHYVAGEIEELASCYTVDGKIFPDGTDIIEGIPDIQRRWTLPPDVTTVAHKVTPHEIKIIEDYAYDYGYYEGKTRRPDGSVVGWKGKSVIVWKKVEDDWKIYLDIWNSLPPALPTKKE